jgi:hypothetical protein
MPYKHEHSARVEEPRKFVAESFRRINITEGVDAIIGKYKSDPDGSTHVQAYRFSISQFSVGGAKEWCKDHDVKWILFEPAEKDDFAELADMEIFDTAAPEAAGFDAAQIVSNFTAIPQKGINLEPPLVIGHDENQPLLTATGLPAAGWIAGLKQQGSKILASVRDVPRVVADLIGKRAYKKISCELYRDFQGMGNALRRVALLGGEIPAIKSLDDVAALYADAQQTVWITFAHGVVKPDTADQEDRQMADQAKQFTEDQVKDLITKQVETATAKLSEQIAAKDAEVKKLSDDLVKAQVATVELRKGAARTEIVRFVEDRKREGKLLPKFEELGLVRFMEELDSTKPVKFAEKIEISPLDWFKRFIGELPQLVKLGEKAGGGAPDGSPEIPAEFAHVKFTEKQIADIRFYHEHRDEFKNMPLLDYVRFNVLEGKVTPKAENR